MNFDILITLEGRDKYGRLTDFTKFKANSAVMGFIDILCTQMSQVNQTITDTGGTPRASTPPANTQFSVNAAAGTVTYGIRVGTGTATVVIGDYALQTAIGHGSSSGLLSYAACAVGVPGTSGTSRQFTVSRTLTNNSGANITVNEIALYTNYASAYYFCVDRTLNTFTINNGSSKTVTYTIKVTV